MLYALRTKRWAQLVDIRYALLLGFVEHYLLTAGDVRRILTGWIFAEMRSRVAFIARKLTTMPRVGGDDAIGPVAAVPFGLPSVLRLPADETRLAELARADREDRFARRPRWEVYKDRVLLVALCQGAALHYLDGRTGVKDLDVYTFYASHPEGPFPYRWLIAWDFGPSELGRHPDDVGFVGRHVDLIGRSLDVQVDADPIEAVQDYLRHSRNTSPRKLAAKAVIAVDPPELRVTQVWPFPAP